MSQHPTLTSEEAPTSQRSTTGAPEALGLAIAWSPGEPKRYGEVAIVPPAHPDTVFSFGRGAQLPSDPHPRLEFVRNRAGHVEPRPALSAPKISRIQLLIKPRGLESLFVESVGRCPLLHNGSPIQSATLLPGDTLQLGHELLLLCIRRHAWVHSLGGEPAPMPFAAVDRHGFVGESPAAWELRRRIAFIAPRPDHVLIVGESGTGKELAARAIHALSPRSSAAFVARNAATFPEGLVDAELFGHAKNYPNAGMPERRGLVGEAAGASLFLDEIAELPAQLQTHLLRVLDAGEYQRLGESALLVSDFRLIAATNNPERLRDDLAARLKLSLEMPTLNDRLEDIPLLVVHLLRTIATSNTDVRARLFPDGDLTSEPRIAMGFVASLLRRHYRTHVRELEALLWDALREGPDQILDARPKSRSQPAPSVADMRPRRAPRAKPIPAEELEATLVANGWNLEETWRAVGLSSRHALARLMAKHGLRRPR